MFSVKHILRLLVIFITLAPRDARDTDNVIAVLPRAPVPDWL
jgi:hypothetical protein